MRRPLLSVLLIATLPLAAHAKSDPTPARALAGRTAGKPVSCIMQSQIQDTQVYDSGDILYTMTGGDRYLNSPQPTCPGLKAGVGMVTRTYGGNLCRGDIVDLVDFQTRIPHGACSLDDFTPYPKPPKAPKHAQ